MNRFEVVRGVHGYGVGISYGEKLLLHLVTGSLRNVENDEKVVAVLNAAANVVRSPAWAGVSDEDVELERALRQLVEGESE